MSITTQHFKDKKKMSFPSIKFSHREFRIFLISVYDVRMVDTFNVVTTQHSINNKTPNKSV